MTLAEIQVTFQAISSLCIAGSFLYGAVQFRNYRRAQYVANFTKLVELQMQLRRMRVDDPALAKVFRDDVKDLHNDAEIREYFFVLMQLSVFEIVWFSHKQGQLPDDYYASWTNRMRAIESEPSFHRMFNNPSMKLMHDEFQKYIADMLAKLPRPK
jgi:hypothetical protein